MSATSSNQDLQVSISFGKFENDSLSWEKFSSFSPNKYLEEVEKCATPGSVAQKKAYFESHYKKIAERKAETILEEEQQQVERNADDTENGHSTFEEDKLATNIATGVNKTSIHEPLEETMDLEECESSAETMNLEECIISVNAGDDKLEKLEEIVCVEEKPELIVQVEEKEEVCMEEEIKQEVKKDSTSKDTCKMNEMPMKETKKEKDHKLIKKTDKNVHTNHARASSKPNQVHKKPVESKIVMSRKIQPSKEKRMIKASNKAASPVSKAPGFSSPRVSKQPSPISSMSSSHSSVKKENVSTLPRKKQTTPKSLHISLNLGTDPTALTTTRKSLIMERMGDKEIVRRAFKSFQKSFDQTKPSVDGQDTAPKQVPAKATTASRLAATGGQKEMGRLAKSDATEKINSSSRTSSFVPKSNRTAAKQMEMSRPGATAVDRIHLQANRKAAATNTKSRRKSLDLKAKSIQGPLPGSSDKVV